MNHLRLLVIAVFVSLTLHSRADDWPQWMGSQRDDVWREQGIVERFDTNGPPVLWRVAIAPSYSGPAVVGQRLYVMDRPKAVEEEAKPGPESQSKAPARERVLCLN